MMEHKHVGQREYPGPATANDPIDRLQADPAFGQVDFADLVKVRDYTGRAPPTVR